jgi:hypothetical protein
MYVVEKKKKEKENRKLISKQMQLGYVLLWSVKCWRSINAPCHLHDAWSHSSPYWQLAGDPIRQVDRTSAVLISVRFWFVTLITRVVFIA